MDVSAAWRGPASPAPLRPCIKSGANSQAENTVDNDEVLTAREVGALLKISRAAVYLLHKNGKLIPRWKLFDKRRGFRWSRADVEAYLASVTVTDTTVSIPEKEIRAIVSTRADDALARPYIRTRERMKQKT